MFVQLWVAILKRVTKQAITRDIMFANNSLRESDPAL